MTHPARTIAYHPLLGILLLSGALSAQQLVGTMQGGQVRLKGMVQVRAGQLLVDSGTEIDVPQGDAELHLERGGTIRICGPARLTVIAGGGGAMLISLQQGGIGLRYASAVPDSVLTPDFRVDTIVPPGEYSSTSASLAMDAQGKLCVHNLGSALTLIPMADGQQRNVIAGDRLLFNPADGSAVVTPSCSCDQPPQPAVVETRQQQEAVGSLFPQTASLKYSAEAPAPETANATPPPVVMKPASIPAPSHHRNFFARIFGWLFGHKHSAPAADQKSAPAASTVNN